MQKLKNERIRKAKGGKKDEKLIEHFGYKLPLACEFTTREIKTPWICCWWTLTYYNAIKFWLMMSSFIRKTYLDYRSKTVFPTTTAAFLTKFLFVINYSRMSFLLVELFCSRNITEMNHAEGFFCVPRDFSAFPTADFYSCIWLFCNFFEFSIGLALLFWLMYHMTKLILKQENWAKNSYAMIS